ncbi:MAG: prolyl oligopeptidase family serine peptidase [Candidatus Thorarchaeota archaeon]
MTERPQILPYHKWIGKLTSEQIFEEIIAFTAIKVVNGNIYWSELRPTEKGRITIVCRNIEGDTYDVLPGNVNVRSRVHEYGGVCWEVDEKYLYYVNFEDQRLYRKTLGTDDVPIPLTPSKNEDGSLGKYAAPILTPEGNALVFVYEKEFDQKENENFIALLDLSKTAIQEPKIIVRGKNFYFDPTFSSNGNQIAWIQYDHPNMPWNSTEVISADFKDNNVVPDSEVIIAGGEGISVCGVNFDSSGRVYFVMDEENQPDSSFKNWWNLYRFENDEIQPITMELAEFTLPRWVLGDVTWNFLPSGQIVANYEKAGKGFLSLIDPNSRVLTTLNSPFDGHDSIQVYSEHEIVLLANSAKRPAALVKLDIQTLEYEILRTSFPNRLSIQDISIPEQIEYPTSDGMKAFGLFYVPKNSNYMPPEGDKPPLIVMVHGGPTGRASGQYSLSRQFWTNQGYAIFDVDHRGSTSYGRRYRDALKGQWGLIDAQDIKDAVDFLVNQGKVAPKVAIRGGSAGGYAVQRALTLFPDTFQVGASYFGIGNLITLTKLIHKFESQYIDWLMGKPLSDPEGEQIYNERSPINHMDRLKSPMILFQGKDDKVVVPEVSREMAEILKEKGIFSEYIEYEGEGHGFRKKENNVDALSKEAAFYRKVLFGK